VLRNLPEDQVERMRTQAAAFGAGALSRAADVANAGLTEMTGATAPRLQLELIAARHARGRMHDDRVADVAAFRVERLLHHQRAVVPAPGEDRLCAAALEAELELGLPGLRDGLGELHGPIIPPAMPSPGRAPCRRRRRARRSRRAP